MTAILFYFAIGALIGLMLYPAIWIICLAIVAGDVYNKEKKMKENPHSLIALILDENPLVAIAIILGVGVIFALMCAIG
jgi:hypothetical protein